jgi:hypothetical protein
MSNNFNKGGEGYNSQDQSPKVVPINPSSTASFKKDSLNLHDAAKNAMKNPFITVPVAVAATLGAQNFGKIINLAETLMTPVATSAIETATENNTTAAQRFADAQKITLASITKERAEADTAHAALATAEKNVTTTAANLELATSKRDAQLSALQVAKNQVKTTITESGEVKVEVAPPSTENYSKTVKEVLAAKGILLKAEQVLAVAKAADAKEAADVPTAEANAQAALSEASQGSAKAKDNLEATTKADLASTQAFEAQGTEAKAVNEKYSAEFYKILATRATKNADGSYTSTDSKFIAQAAKAATKNNMKPNVSANGLTISF